MGGTEENGGIANMVLVTEIQAIELVGVSSSRFAYGWLYLVAQIPGHMSQYQYTF